MKSASRSKVDSLKKKPLDPLAGKIVTSLERENARTTSSFSTTIMRFRLDFHEQKVITISPMPCKISVACIRVCQGLGRGLN